MRVGEGRIRLEDIRMTWAGPEQHLCPRSDSPESISSQSREIRRSGQVRLSAWLQKQPALPGVCGWRLGMAAGREAASSTAVTRVLGVLCGASSALGRGSPSQLPFLPGCTIFENCKSCRNGSWGGTLDDFYIKGIYCAECRAGWYGGDCMSKCPARAGKRGRGRERRGRARAVLCFSRCSCTVISGEGTGRRGQTATFTAGKASFPVC